MLNRLHITRGRRLSDALRQPVLRVGAVALAIALAGVVPAAAQTGGGDSEATQEEKALEDLLGDDEDIDFKGRPPPPDATGRNRWDTPGTGGAPSETPVDPDSVITAPAPTQPAPGAPSAEQRHAAQIYVEEAFERRLARVEGRVPTEDIDKHMVYTPSPQARQNPGVAALERRLWQEKLKEYQQQKLAARLLKDLDAGTDGRQSGGAGTQQDATAPAPRNDRGPAAGGATSRQPTDDRIATRGTGGAGEQPPGTVTLGDPPPQSPQGPSAFEKFIAQSGVLDEPAATASAPAPDRAPSATAAAPERPPERTAPVGDAVAATPKPKPAPPTRSGDPLAARDSNAGATANDAAARPQPATSGPAPAAPPPPPDPFADRFGFSREIAALSGQTADPATADAPADASAGPPAAAPRDGVPPAYRDEVAAVAAARAGHDRLAYLEPAEDDEGENTRAVRAGRQTIFVVDDDAAADRQPFDTREIRSGEDRIVLRRPERQRASADDHPSLPAATPERPQKCFLFIFCSDG